MTPVGVQALLFINRGLVLSPVLCCTTVTLFTLWATLAVPSTLVHRLIGLFWLFSNEEAKEVHRRTSRRRDTT